MQQKRIISSRRQYHQTPLSIYTFYDTARVALEAGLAEHPEDARLHSALGIAYAGLGRKQDAIRHGKRAEEILPVSRDAVEGPVYVTALAEIYVMVGEYDAAIDQLDYLLSMPGETSVPLLRIDPTWDPLRDYPRFQALLERYE